ncbi:MAG TPA: SOS response-associated peptidase [Acidimicrobiales bacterium]|jgi:putative SOS response-associated peptidase YedK|nr:SOS response-associated peptidase [Acidimicrobiales bacterium]
MCGRFALYTPPDQLARLFDAELGAGLGLGFEPHWNITPTTQILGLRFGGGGGPEGPARLPLVLDRFRWGLIPPQAKDPSQGSRLFNARAETVTTKPSFQASFAQRRMAVLADGFFEWRKGPGRGRQPHYFHRADGRPLVLAGLWADWRDPGPEAGERPAVRSCTIITTSAGQDMDGVHDRMPVILAPDVLERWTDPAGADDHELSALLRAAPTGTLRHHPVDQRAGNVRNDDPALIAPLAAPATLF